MKHLANMHAALLDVRQRYPNFAVAVRNGVSRVTRVTFLPNGVSRVEPITDFAPHADTARWLRDLYWNPSPEQIRQVSWGFASQA